MPRFIFEINGQRHVFEGPDQATTARFAQQWAADPRNTQAPHTFLGDARSLASGVVRGAAGIADSLPSIQSLSAAAEAAAPSAAFVGQKLGLMTPEQAKALPAQVHAFRHGNPFLQTNTERMEASGLLHNPGNAQERFANTVGEFAPNAFSPEAAGSGLVRTAIAKGAKVLLPAAGATAAPAVVKAAGGGPIAQTAAGVAGAALGGVAGAEAVPQAAGMAERAAAARAASPAGRLTAEGIPLTPGQNAGGLARSVEDKAMSLPITGDAISGARRRGVEALNRAVANRALAPIGETLPADVNVGHNAVAHVERQLGKAYTRAAGTVTNLTPDAELGKAIADRAAALTDLPQDVQDKFAAMVKSQVTDPLTSGSGSGDQLISIQSKLGQKAADYGQQGGDSAELGRALKGVSDDLDELASRQNPDYGPAKSAADEGWANFVRMRQAAQMQASKGGIFTPAQLKMAVRSQDKSVGRGATARGDALLGQLADDAEQTMGGGYPDSGTTGRMILTGALTGATPFTHGATLPIAAGLGAAAAPYAMMARGVPNAFAAADLAPRSTAVARDLNAMTGTPISITSLGLPAATAVDQAANQ